LIHRRRFIVTTIAALLAAPFSSDAGFTKGRELAPFPKEFKAGDCL